MKLAFIGGGNMATAILNRLVANGQSAAQIQVVEPSPAQQESIRTAHPSITVLSNATELEPCEIVVLAVKPQVMQIVCESLAPEPWIKNALVVSIAAGTTLKSLSNWLGGHSNLVRSMPNTPALIGLGVTGIYALPQTSGSMRAAAQEILAAVGQTIWFDSEAHLDTVTAISGSGPAYFFYWLEAMQAAGQAKGLSPEQARTLAVQTAIGAAHLADSSEESLAVLRERVTSKGGTTAAALAVMNERGVAESIEQAISAAHARAIQLGQAL
jgi:pyrroline-5-carboxylate reductase